MANQGRNECFGFYHVDGMCKEYGCKQIVLCRSFTTYQGLDVMGAVVEEIVNTTKLTSIEKDATEFVVLEKLIEGDVNGD